MSVAELTPRGGEFERTPPHDLAAEQCVLGGMLMSKDAISDVMEVISPLDHYRPAHQLVHEAILELYSRGEPADPVTVSDLLAKRGELARIGGGAYLHTLLASVPTAANAGYYARIVRERAILRRLVEAGTRIVQLGYAGDGEADELVDRAEAEIYGVTERRVSEDYLPLADIMPGALDEIEAIGSRGGVMTGVRFSLVTSRNEITMRLLGSGGGLDQAGAHDERSGRRAAVHRRLAEHVADADRGQMPPSHAVGEACTWCSWATQ
jgi:replicative DNA helicase